MVEFNKDILLKSNVVVHCDTLEKAKNLIEWAKTIGFLCNFHDNNYYDIWEEDSCYSFREDRVGSISYYRVKEYTIIEYEEVILNKTYKQGDIVLAKRDDFETQAIYYGEINGKYAVDFNGTSCMIVDSVEILPTYTKKEAKQKVSKLFANPKDVSSDKVRKIIDRISL